MPDDKRNQATYRFYLRPIKQGNYGKEPKHIFEIKGGDVWYEFSNTTWSKDSTMYAFMTWEREKTALALGPYLPAITARAPDLITHCAAWIPALFSISAMGDKWLSNVCNSSSDEVA